MNNKHFEHYLVKIGFKHIHTTKVSPSRYAKEFVRKDEVVIFDTASLTTYYSSKSKKFGRYIFKEDLVKRLKPEVFKLV